MVTDIARNAEVAAVLGDVPQGMSLGEGDTGVIVSAHTGHKIRMYSMIDGEPRDILRIDAERVMRKRLPDNRPAFWMEGMSGSPPEYKRGNVRCYMHPEFDEHDGPAEIDRAWIDSIGLAGRMCNMSDVSKPNKADFRSVYDRDAHMRAKHKDEMRIIEAAKERAQRMKEAEERRLDREAMQALARAAITQVTPQVAPVEEQTTPRFFCEQCDYVGTEHGLKVHLGQRHKE